MQLVLLGALVYVAYPFISTAPTFFSGLKTANWWWALLGLTVSALTYVGAAAAFWASTDGTVNFWKCQLPGSRHFCRDHHPRRRGRAGAQHQVLAENGLCTMRATAAVALQQTVQVIITVLLLIFFSTVAGVSADLLISSRGPRCCIYRRRGAGYHRRVFVRAQAAKWLATGLRPRL